MTPARHGGAAMRLRALFRKELLQVVRDPSAIGIAFVLPVLLLLIFGYGVSLDAQRVPIAVVIEQPDDAAEGLAGAFRHNPWFAPVTMRTMREAEQALTAGEVDAILHVRPDFDRRLRGTGEPAAQLVVKGTDANTARLVTGYVQDVWGRWLAQQRPREASMAGATLEARIWFNPSVRSRNFLVPGLIAVIMTLIGALLTALIMAREWERGTMESLLVTPVTVGELLAGKILPYYALGMTGMALSVTMAVWEFGVPLRGSPWVLLVATSLFLLAALGMGLLISTIARVQFVAAQVAIITTFLPAFILSGFIFDIGSMPWGVRVITYLVPARYFVAILQTAFLAGDVGAVIIPNALALAGWAAAFLGLTRWLSRKHLD